RPPRHLDGHQHVHALPGVREVVARFGDPGLPIRVPRDVAWWIAPSARVLVVARLARGLEAVLPGRPAARFAGLGLYRHPRFARALERLLRGIPAGRAVELMVHPRLPSRGDEVAAAELAALCDVRLAPTLAEERAA
ncbi:MAG: ChbG/HpnK family deacetylase, partial [Sandaracinaceae bacterium]